jgi:hypothetical protein
MSQIARFSAPLARAMLATVISCSSACASDEGAAVDDSAASSTAELDAVAQAVVDPVYGPIASGSALSPLPSAGSFRYYEISNARCRDGSPAGVAIRKPAVPSSKVVVYLEGGGACFNTQTCLANPANVAVDHRTPPLTGIFDPNKSNNPFAGWNVVFVPYCTGDFHLGNKVSSVDFGPSNQLFHGRRNLDLILPSVVKTLPGMTKVVLAGSSAGGVGAIGNATPVKRQFGKAGVAPDLRVIDDAGPYLSSGNTFFNDYLPVGEQAKWNQLWGLDTTVLADCPSCNVPNFFTAVATNTKNVIGKNPALIVGKQDLVVALLYGNARADQYPLVGFFGVDMRQALDDFRTRMTGSFSTYYVTTPDADAQQHTWLLSPNFYSVAQQPISGGANRSMVSWVNSYVNTNVTVPEVGP